MALLIKEATSAASSDFHLRSLCRDNAFSLIVKKVVLGFFVSFCLETRKISISSVY